MSGSLLPRDPLLPHLGLALDGDAMAGVFAASLELALTGCRVDRVKYRPRRNLTVSYRLRLRDGNGRAIEQIVATRWCHGGEAARRHAKASSRTPLPTAAGPALLHDPLLDLVAHWWPNDAKLAAAATLASPDTLQRQWLPAVAAALGPGAAPRGAAQLRLVQVVPEHRATARVTWQGMDGAARQAFAKADARGAGDAVQALMRALWHSPAQRRGELRTPRPLGWQSGSGLHWQQALPGKDLLDHAPGVTPEIAARVGALLAALHATSVPVARTVTLEELRCTPLDVASTLALVEPAFAADAQQLAQALVRRVTELALQPMATLHGDLHPRNLLLDDEGRLGLIDLDSVRRGPVPLDLGAWLADAAYRDLLADADPGRSLPAGRAFVEAHAAVLGHRVPEPLLAWAVAYQLLCQRAWRCLVNLKPGRYPRIGALLALARRLLERGHLDALAAPPAAWQEAA